VWVDPLVCGGSNRVSRTSITLSTDTITIALFGPKPASRIEACGEPAPPSDLLVNLGEPIGDRQFVDGTAHRPITSIPSFCSSQQPVASSDASTFYEC
jgi:hypothetical protein